MFYAVKWHAGSIPVIVVIVIIIIVSSNTKSFILLVFNYILCSTTRVVLYEFITRADKYEQRTLFASKFFPFWIHLAFGLFTTTERDYSHRRFSTLKRTWLTPFVPRGGFNFYNVLSRTLCVEQLCVGIALKNISEGCCIQWTFDIFLPNRSATQNTFTAAQTRVFVFVLLVSTFARLCFLCYFFIIVHLD